MYGAVINALFRLPLLWYNGLESSWPVPEIRAADGLDSGDWMNIGSGEEEKQAFKFTMSRAW